MSIIIIKKKKKKAKNDWEQKETRQKLKKNSTTDGRQMKDNTNRFHIGANPLQTNQPLRPFMFIIIIII